MPQYILSDPEILSQIKKLQYRQQVPPLALLIIGFLISVIVPIFDLRYLSMAICLAAIIWYLYVGACFRFRNRIPMPDHQGLLSPLTGRIKHLKSTTDAYQLVISKHALDTVEIRCPLAGSRWEEDKLKLDFEGNSLAFRFEAEKLIKLDKPEPKPGEVIGLLIGKASCQIILPRSKPCILSSHTLCEAGITELVPASE